MDGWEVVSFHSRGSAGWRSRAVTAPRKEDDLQALLHDEPMTSVAIGALTASDGGVVTGVAGAPGTGAA